MSLPGQDLDRGPSSNPYPDSYGRYGYYPAPAVEVDEAALPIAQCIDALRRNWWLIGFVIILSAGGAYFGSSKLGKVYESTATLDVDRSAPAAVIGRNSLREDFGGDSSEAFLTTQVELLKSDAVLRPVAERFGDRHAGLRAAAMSNAAVEWRDLKVTRVPNTNLIRIQFRSGSPTLSADVANAIAERYVEQTYRLRLRSSANLAEFMQQQVAELKDRMTNSAVALMRFEKELNVIDPEQKATMLSARILQLNTEFTAAQAERMKKEAALEQVRTGTTEAAQVSTQGQDLAKITDRIDVARDQFSTAKAIYGTKHPEYVKALGRLNELVVQFEEAKAHTVRRSDADYAQSAKQEQRLQTALQGAKAEFDSLKSRSFAYQNLKSSAEEDKKLYEELIRKIRESDINAGFRDSTIRIADPARPADLPAFPNLKLNAVLAAIISAVVAVAFVVARVGLDKSLRSPEQVSAALNVQLMGVLPAAKGIEALLKPDASYRTSLLSGARRPIARDESQLAGYQEAIRNLRNWIFLKGANQKTKLRSILITSAVSGEGKSTIASHLAIANAKHRKTLLIDADLRRTSISERFGLQQVPGLSDALGQGTEWRNIVTPLPGYDNIDFLAAGSHRTVASDLIGPNFQTILDEATSSYDFVIIDAPPILGFAESLEIATKVDGVLLIFLYGSTERKLVIGALSALERLGANILGVALNQAPHYANYLKQYRPTPSLLSASGAAGD